ncbi:MULTISPECIES: SDR family NAD(P)-dependent oxidoreductase [unclassified Sphingobium]|uniref:SDR family NAD(P)-dependent oxidoreductase n=1 Tax=unclassified Sphingobium TaxID=2611147 RepID=UPI000D165265|nr:MULTISPECIES: SDR family NAD(P)-dependent oxidoreductase [unclassified Sphingobium]MBG6119929.1 NAD(P)-dependent dehydrogenase (short-subunit alcohol dehydrogenase family) [Sphingobium sp. JAI105]PSO11904.1 short-chain dehydrogenase [Sphingobium sp. AEW4]TWC96522.1 short-subunit dehydrogenase [Sphingobium sp. AEW010]TWD16409.1 short-subunit dehydrogenase [Sphingobium sp. AEW013]TWD19278.1 short-subunit dehydrogenase [Sphingobium sp. AEW001]
MLDLQLTGRSALVTGASSGIGTCIAHALAEQGAHIFVHGRDPGRTSAVAAAITAAGGKAEAVTGDLGEAAGLEAVIGVVAAAGGVDILVNNAGGPAGDFSRRFEAIPREDWLATYASNTVAAAELSRKLLGAMRERNWGRLIHIASATAMQPTELGSDYAACKGAIVNLSVSIARSLSGVAITSNVISPGVIATASVAAWVQHIAQEKGWSDLAPADRERRVAREIFGIDIVRLGRPADVAHAVLMLASPLGDFINGANIRVDGGHVLTVN